MAIVSRAGGVFDDVAHQLAQSQSPLAAELVKLIRAEERMISARARAWETFTERMEEVA